MSSILTKIRTGRIALTRHNPIAAMFCGLAVGPARPVTGATYYEYQGKSVCLGRTLLLVAPEAAAEVTNELAARFTKAGQTGEIVAVAIP